LRNRFPFLTFIFILASCYCTSAQQHTTQSIAIAVDLNNVKDDKVLVEVSTPIFSTNEITYHFAKIIPGTYAIADYGRFVEEVKAYDHVGNNLTIERKDVNTILIKEATKLARLTYWVNDTFDVETGADVFSSKEQVIFSPAGTNILAGKQFWMNLCGFIGYFSGYEEVPYQLTIQHPVHLFGATAKDDLDVSTTLDKFSYTHFADVVDNPIMYSKPDTAIFKVGDMEVLLSCYTPNGQLMAQTLKPALERMMKAQKAFLGNLNTTKKYVVLAHLSTMGEGEPKGIGALEHNNSTSAVFKIPMNTQDLIGVISHEFFHTITPLKVHSKEIRYFDFETPKMSRHLWFYEGVTEYFANLFQVNQGLISEDNFYDLMATKISSSGDYNDSLSFTEMSKNVLQDKMKVEYPNVYQKGALIAMCLDIMIRENSKGEKGLRWLMGKLIEKYGVDKPFDDETFIATVGEMTFKELNDFLVNHVQGAKPIAYPVYLNRMGLQATTVQMAAQNAFVVEDQVYIDVDPDGKSVLVTMPDDNNNFLNALGLKEGDVLLNINGTAFIPEDGYASLLLGVGFTEGDAVTLTISRNGKKMIVKGKAKLNYADQDGFRFKDQTKIELKNNWLRK
jgi:predicted metalloprotease with PDZ domain